MFLKSVMLSTAKKISGLSSVSVRSASRTDREVASSAVKASRTAAIRFISCAPVS
jgi:hypothetical protein